MRRRKAQGTAKEAGHSSVGAERLPQRFAYGLEQVVQTTQWAQRLLRGNIGLIKYKTGGQCLLNRLLGRSSKGQLKRTVGLPHLRAVQVNAIEGRCFSTCRCKADDKCQGILLKCLPTSCAA